jgi:hypothetical protein
MLLTYCRYLQLEEEKQAYTHIIIHCAQRIEKTKLLKITCILVDS